MKYRQLPTFRIVLVLILSTMFLGLHLAAANAQGINVQKKKSRLHEVADFKLRGTAKSEFKQFKRKAEFYGAFFANPSENTAGYYYNASSIAVAEDYARTVCQASSRNPFGCVLYARMLPKKFDPTEPGLTLSRQGNKDFREYQRLQDPERYGAFAQSDNGASGFSWAEHNRDSAEEEALRRCEKAARKLLRKTPEHLRTTVADPSKQICRVVHRSG
ncbi:hypothetical protein shim_22880 [Shimia sp. SK013]|uniref:hypothetical protein n=1 Tax=Shimia sp. SK013 TaxID=1389006 RepID=UPI0006B657FC|nr:hypothetical protein [Shimia sp. SK013]KPA21581.1 hypothetical protein shim_22880 [Shimia sp. SK013]